MHHEVPCTQAGRMWVPTRCAWCTGSGEVIRVLSGSTLHAGTVIGSRNGPCVAEEARGRSCHCCVHVGTLRAADGSTVRICAHRTLNADILASVGLAPSICTLLAPGPFIFSYKRAGARPAVDALHHGLIRSIRSIMAGQRDILANGVLVVPFI